MKSNASIASLLAVSLFVLAGCAATPAVREERPISADLSRYSVVQVAIEAPAQIRQQHGYDVTSAELLKEFIAQVQASGKYATVSAEAPRGKALEARLLVTEFNYVSGASRGLLGVMGGRAILNVTMTLKDKDTSDVVGTVAAGHTSSHAQGVFSPTTSGQISAIAKELSAKLAGR